MNQIGDAWSMLVLREAFYGRRRFSEFVKYTGAQKTVVSDRLKRLVSADIFERVEYSEHPTRFHYELTPKGRELAPVLLALTKWGDQWTDQGSGAPVTFTHTDCGHDADPTVVCGSCGEPIGSENVTASTGPGYPSEWPDVFR